MSPSDIAGALKGLVKVNKGQSVRSAASSTRLNALQDIVRALARGDNVQTGPNIRKKTGDGFFILTADTKKSFGGGESPETPFQVISRINPNPQIATLELGVISNSHLFNSEDKDTYEEDNSDWGLLDDDQQDGWWQVADISEIGHKIWLQIELSPDDQSITSIDIKHEAVTGSDWSTYPNPIEINDDDPNNVYQQFYHQIIAEITDPDQDPRDGLVLTIPNSDPPQQIQVTQILFTDLMMTTAHTTRDSEYADVPLLVAVPWHTLAGTAIDGSADEINDVDPPTDGGDPMTPWSFGAADTDEAPFQVVPTPKNGDSAIGVIGNSHLFNTEDRDTYEEDNSEWGLLSDDQTQGSFDVPSKGNKIWLQIELSPDDQSIVSIDVKSGPVTGGEWSTYPNPVELNDDDPNNVYQQFYHQIIAEVTDPEQDPRPGFIIGPTGSEVQVTQLLFNNLEMTTAHTTQDSKYPDVPLLVAVASQMLPGTDIAGNADEINDVPSPGNNDDPMTPWAFGPPNTTQTPFQVIPVLSAGENMIGVISNSHVFNSEDKDTYEEDNSDWGLLNDDQTQGAFQCPGLGGKIWLRFTLDQDDQSITSIDVLSGSPWSTYPDPIAINVNDPDNPWQEYYHQLIAEVTDPEQDPRPGFQVGDVQVTQLLFSNLMMTTGQTTSDADEPGLPLLVAIPSQNLPGTGTDGSADEIPSEPDLMTPWQLGSQETLNDFNFELFNASEPDAPKVLVLDGVVYGPNGDGVDPQGMPSDDTFTLDVQDEWEIFAQIIWTDTNQLVIDQVFLIAQDTTPDDSETVTYVTIGSVSVDTSGDVPIVSCRNEVCGDISVEGGSLNDYNFKLLDATSDLGFPSVYILNGVVIGPNDDPIDPEGMGGDRLVSFPVTDGDEIYLVVQWDMETDDGVSGDNIVSVGIGIQQHTPDDNGLIQYITIGHVDVTTSPNTGVTAVVCTNEVCGDVVIQYPPYLDSNELLQLSVDPETGNVVWKTSKIAQITTENASGFSGGGSDFLSEIDVLTFDENSFDVYDGGGGQVVVKLTDNTGFSVQGTDGSFIDNVNHIQFEVSDDPSASFIHVYQPSGQNGVAIVVVPLIPPHDTGISVLGDDNGDTHWFPTSVCS